MERYSSARRGHLAESSATTNRPVERSARRSYLVESSTTKKPLYYTEFSWKL